MKFLRGLSGRFLTFAGTILTIGLSTGDYISIGGKLIFFYTSAIAVGDAVPTTAVAGSWCLTTNVAGKGQLFISDGSNWQDYFSVKVVAVIATVPTAAGNTDIYTAAPFTGKLLGVIASFTDALTTNDTNYVTFSLANITQASAAMLAATDANTTKATGGTALAANTARSLTLHGTAGNLATTAYDRLRFRVAGSGTLANTLTNGLIVFVYQRS